MGKQPNQLQDQVLCTVDTVEMLLASKLEVAGGQATTPAQGFNVIGAAGAFTVPANQVWVLKAITAFGLAEAGVTFSISPALRFGGSIAPTLAPPEALVASSSTSNGVTTPDLWLPSGTELGVRVDRLTGVPTAASTLNLNIIFARLRAGA